MVEKWTKLLKLLSLWLTRICERKKKKENKNKVGLSINCMCTAKVLQLNIFWPLTSGSWQTACKSLQYQCQHLSLQHNFIEKWKHHWADWLVFAALRIQHLKLLHGRIWWIKMHWERQSWSLPLMVTNKNSGITVNTKVFNFHEIHLLPKLTPILRSLFLNC